MTNKRKKFIEERVKDPLASGAEVARRAGYAPKDAKREALRLMNDERIAKKVNSLIDVGLDTLEDVALHDKNGIARATAAKTLVETALGKPKDNKQSNFGDVTINIHRLDPETLQTVVEPLKQLQAS